MNFNFIAKTSDKLKEMLELTNKQIYPLHLYISNKLYQPEMASHTFHIYIEEIDSPYVSKKINESVITLISTSFGKIVKHLGKDCLNYEAIYQPVNGIALTYEILTLKYFDPVLEAMSLLGDIDRYPDYSEDEYEI